MFYVYVLHSESDAGLYIGFSSDPRRRLREHQAGLAPAIATPARAAYYRWMFFCAYTLMPAYRSWFYADEPAGDAHAALVRERARIQLEAAWQQLADHLQRGGPYMLGERLSAVDFVATMLMRWSRNMPKPADRWSALGALAQRVKERPSWKRLYAIESLSEWS